MMQGSLKGAAGLQAAQQQIEALMSSFEVREFSAISQGVSVVLTGDMVMKSLSSSNELVSTADVTAAYAQAMTELVHERNTNFVRIRNAVQKKFRIDIKDTIPEVNAAIEYFNARQKAG
jgi:DNA-binding protein YbaB